MLIEFYYQELCHLIENYELVKWYEINCDQRGIYEGFIKAKIHFKDNSILHLREFIYVELKLDRKMYAYQYMDNNNKLIFRYDNAEHHRQLNLPNFPHHKHDKNEDNVINSHAPFLNEILPEILAIKNDNLFS